MFRSRFKKKIDISHLDYMNSFKIMKYIKI